MPRRDITEISYPRKLVRAARRELRRDPLQSAASLAHKVACSQRTLNRAFAAAGCVMREERERMRLDRAAQVLSPRCRSSTAALRGAIAVGAGVELVRRQEVFAAEVARATAGYVLTSSSLRSRAAPVDVLSDGA